MKQKQILISLFLLVAFCLKAQDKVSFDYDEAGNRISRKVVPLSHAKSNKNPKPDPVVEELGERKVVVYPNPTKGALAVEVTGGDPKDEIRIILFSAQGVILQNTAAKVAKTPIDMSGYPDAWYILRVITGDKKTEFKILKQ
ncbi:MAG: T9SS type A sorting domain-containing protein [Bacteroidales bacterium]|nr:T9SS type A sorting domain-containing protein [Bacteroidales bacterium]